ncbi:hypothetical protein K2173_002133 [Erythroxylum novogranatense]|uniref:Apple domain-containing protein n=1 Tax=Erythroxylum novogranatense TaxID=1862640 RepID=A0AAV8SQI7_9ROSI|nr:hypothetical protein K2173_002133 [Erythroxylum novogranatense]
MAGHHLHALAQLLLFVLSIVYLCTPSYVLATQQELLVGFTAKPEPSVSSYQPLLNDSTGNFSMGFLRLHRTQLALVVIHVRSLEPLWQADPTSTFHWSDQTQIDFNGSLLISDPQTGFWSTGTQGDKVVLLNDSNLQIQKLGASPEVIWQSFDYPTNTLVTNQNFTSKMSLVSSNGLYSMRLGDNFMALYAKFATKADHICWKHKALEARANIVEGKGPIYARINSDGFLGMYQTNDAAVDMQTFKSFHRSLDAFLMVRLEQDGNLRGYYFDGTNWVLDYQAIANSCELPSPCGSYSLCGPSSACSCLDNRTENSGGCSVNHESSGDFCGILEPENSFTVLRRKAVELPFKELMSYTVESSLDQCETLCANNCSCWGVVYSNTSQFCYLVDYPIQTLLRIGDESKSGYFKVKQEAKKKSEVRFTIGIGALCVSILLMIGAGVGGGYRVWRRRKELNRTRSEDDGVLPGPYKELGSASFKSIEMCSGSKE